MNRFVLTSTKKTTHFLCNNMTPMILNCSLKEVYMVKYLKTKHTRCPNIGKLNLANF